MTDVHKALTAFWGSFSFGGEAIPAYLSGHVPDGAAFPYITFEVADGSAMSRSVLTAIVWCRAVSGLNVNAQRAAILDSIAAAIPEEGTLVRLPGGGMLALYRNSAGFQSYYDDPEDASVIGGRTSYEIAFYHD